MKYLKRRKQERLYKQWSKHAELPAHAVPPPEMLDEARAWGVQESRFYRFRVRIVDMVKKVLRVE